LSEQKFWQCIIGFIFFELYILDILLTFGYYSKALFFVRHMSGVMILLKSLTDYQIDPFSQGWWYFSNPLQIIR